MVNDEEGKRPSFSKRLSLRRPMIEKRIEGGHARENSSVLELRKLKRETLFGDLEVLTRGAFSNSMERVIGRMEKGNIDDVEGMLVVAVDIDDMKQVNSVGGYEAGDKVLVNAAEALSESFRLGLRDKVARAGKGDELLATALIKDQDSVEKILHGDEDEKGRIEQIQDRVEAGLLGLRQKYNLPEGIGGVTLQYGYIDREDLIGMKGEIEEGGALDMSGLLMKRIGAGLETKEGRVE